MYDLDKTWRNRRIWHQLRYTSKVVDEDNVGALFCDLFTWRVPCVRHRTPSVRSSTMWPCSLSGEQMDPETLKITDGTDDHLKQLENVSGSRNDLGEDGPPPSQQPDLLSFVTQNPEPSHMSGYMCTCSHLIWIMSMTWTETWPSGLHADQQSLQSFCSSFKTVTSPDKINKHIWKTGSDSYVSQRDTDVYLTHCYLGSCETVVESELGNVGSRWWGPWRLDPLSSHWNEKWQKNSRKAEHSLKKDPSLMHLMPTLKASASGRAETCCWCNVKLVSVSISSSEALCRYLCTWRFVVTAYCLHTKEQQCMIWKTHSFITEYRVHPRAGPSSGKVSNVRFHPAGWCSKQVKHIECITTDL